MTIAGLLETCQRCKTLASMLDESLLHLMRQVLPFLDKANRIKLVAVPELVIHYPWQHLFEICEAACPCQLGNGCGKPAPRRIFLRNPQQHLDQPIDINSHRTASLPAMQAGVVSRAG